MTQKPEAELKLCPCCRNTAKLHSKSPDFISEKDWTKSKHRIKCTICPVGTGWISDKEKLIVGWNTRAADQGNQKAVEITGETSDGYHTFNELYEHRHILFLAVLAAHKERSWRSKLHSDGSMFDGWFIAGIETELGQATYHLPIRMWSLFEGINELPAAPEWDGHTSNDVLVRVRDHAIRRHTITPSEPTITLSSLKALAEGMKNPPFHNIGGIPVWDEKDKLHNAALERAKMWVDTAPNAPKHFTKHGNEECRNTIRALLDAAISQKKGGV